MNFFVPPFFKFSPFSATYIDYEQSVVLRDGKENGEKKMAVRNPGGEKRAISGGHLFSRGFLLRHVRRTKREKDCS